MLDDPRCHVVLQLPAGMRDREDQQDKQGGDKGYVSGGDQTHPKGRGRREV